MEKQTHTPTPWWVEDRRKVPLHAGGGALQIQAKHRGEGSSFCIATINTPFETPEANATLIVRAVNCHDDLVKALREMLACPDIADNDRKKEETHAAERLARAAIARATAEQSA